MILERVACCCLRRGERADHVGRGLVRWYTWYLRDTFMVPWSIVRNRASESASESATARGGRSAERIDSSLPKRTRVTKTSTVDHRVLRKRVVEAPVCTRTVKRWKLDKDLGRGAPASDAFCKCQKISSLKRSVLSLRYWSWVATREILPRRNDKKQREKDWRRAI